MKRFDQINVIPFIDIMLVMLALVLTTATFIAQGIIPVNLPEASNSETRPARESFEILVNDKGVIHVRDEAVSIEQLADYLAELSQRTHIVLRIDSSVKFSSFVGIVDQLKGKGLKNVSILAERAQ